MSGGMENAKVLEDVSKPKHYLNGRDYEPAWVIDDAYPGYFNATAVKYLMRAGRKDGESEVKDLMKARQYIDFQIQKLEGRKPKWVDNVRQELDAPNTSGIAPCSQCGRTSVRLEYDDFGVLVYCCHCGFCSGIKENEKEAISAWNELEGK